ncbi:MAG: nucleoside-diphosphate kinase [Candidatus Diapherotrites archaeon]|uniref:Nucleoside diphosphate kinase n=1 Tax=Candidatus Iainarchaeum sp. TaxID=3101447 RepID=A0A8T4L992_9ARCH|nr:nucleoside-diphosphate kinase [Candidatus Diapherotrites archaeon]
MAHERTLVIIKPDAIQRELAGEILTRFERKGLKMIGLKLQLLPEETIRDHYAHLREKVFFEELVEFMTNTPSILIVLEGKECVEVVRRMVGTTNARSADIGSIRGDYGMSVQSNLVHASESLVAAQTEIDRFFKPGEIHDFTKISFHLVYSSAERD